MITDPILHLSQVKLTNSQIKRIADLVICHTKTDIFDKSKSQNIVDARALFDYIMRVEFNQTLFNIRDYYLSKGKKRHHTTIMYSVKNFTDVVYRNPHYLEIVEIVLTKEVSPRQITNIYEQLKFVKTKKQLKKIKEFISETINEA